jgi:xanthine dehydrogenase accessory factor
LDLGKTTHKEIAVAILAELVQLRASGAMAGSKGSGARTGRAKAARSQAVGQVLRDAEDPVCGMTVTVTAASRPLRHDGTDYYFCCAGCRRAFEENPDAYLKRETRC